ncbi:MAG: hypothetical protein ABI870_09245 [Rhodanobacter sp.]
MTGRDYIEARRELLSQFLQKDVVPRADIPEPVWIDLEARGILERTLGGYLRLTQYGRTLLAN